MKKFNTDAFFLLKLIPRFDQRWKFEYFVWKSYFQNQFRNVVIIVQKKKKRNFPTHSLINHPKGINLTVRKKGTQYATNG